MQFNVDADKRDGERSGALFRECLEIVLKAWTEDPFTHQGEFYQFPVPGWHETNRMFFPLDSRYHAPDGEYVGMYVHPRPYQKPRAARLELREHRAADRWRSNCTQSLG